MKRLVARLVLSFALAIALTTGVVALLAARQAADAFTQYSSYRGAQADDVLLETLASHYQAHGGWQEVEASLRLWEREELPRAPMMRSWPGFSFPDTASPQIVLIDAQGMVLYDGSRRRPMRGMSADEQSDAQPILLEGELVGHLVVAMPMRNAVPGPLEKRFLDRLRSLLMTAAAIAGALGLVLAFAMSRSLSAPLQRLAVAARTVAGGDLGHRVAVAGSAEVAEVSTAFNEMAEGLQKAEMLRQNLMADVAHELRTPLTVLRGNLQAILEGVFPADERELQVLYDETQLLSRLVDDVRELALADAGRLSMAPRPTDLAQVLRASVDGLQPEASAKNINLALQLPEELSLAWADPDRLAQVVSNLLVNALRHTLPDGEITVAAAETGEGLEVVVRHTGVGISPEDLPHVFDRFWRQDPARTPDERGQVGSGLGLSIARSLIRAQGGRIWAESLPGQGATFRFTLPTHTESELPQDNLPA